MEGRGYAPRLQWRFDIGFYNKIEQIVVQIWLGNDVSKCAFREKHLNRNFGLANIDYSV